MMTILAIMSLGLWVKGLFPSLPWEVAMSSVYIPMLYMIISDLIEEPVYE